MSKVFLITPPFTQLNTPYPATAYLKGFLNTKNISSTQADLGIEVTRIIFSKSGFEKLFQIKLPFELTPNAARIYAFRSVYINTIDSVMKFLEGSLPTFAHQICSRKILPEASRFEQAVELGWAFGSMGIQDKAKHLATLYLEDISDFIKECIDPHFGFSRYAERLGRSANSFDELYETLQGPFSFVDAIMLPLLQEKINTVNPLLMTISVPFPGNLYAAFRCGQFVKKNFPNVKVAMGGGFANTELRSLTDKRVFEFFDFITLDDGEAPLENLISFLDGNKSMEDLKRTYLLANDSLVYINNESCSDYKQGQVGTPDYSDLDLTKYFSAIETINPMHSLWSDGRWNKLTMAHGCYWGKCTFCDVSLDYIKNYEPLTASVICDRMEVMIAQTGQTGFHFVDEAAPPALMKSLAIEIIKRKMIVSWWTNIRFEKSFTRDLCLLLKASGCIGVSGGLEVASDRLLALIQKGITVAQVARVNKNFTEAGIMVHAYLMYGFPTQTAQETIDSLEMVRQLFATGILQSAFWHQFAMTAHSPVGMNPERFNVIAKKAKDITFADNDVEHGDPTGAEHELFSFGLKKSLHNYMQGIALDEPLHKWFDFKTPRTTVLPNFILNVLESPDDNRISAGANARYLYLGIMPQSATFVKSKKGNHWEMMNIVFQSLKETTEINVDKKAGEWLLQILEMLSIEHSSGLTKSEISKHYEQCGMEDFELFWDNKPISQLYKVGLLCV